MITRYCRNATRLVLGLGAAFLVPAVFAQSFLSVGNVPGFPGATVDVPISLTHPTGTVTAAQFDILYDASRATAGAPVASARLANHTVRSREIAPGLRRALVYSLANPPVAGTNGPITHVPFTIASHELIGSGPLLPDRVILAGVANVVLGANNLAVGNVFVTPANRLANGHVQFFLQSTEGQRYAIQASTNLTEWISISTNIATGAFLQSVDIDAPAHPYRFYRWRWLTE